MPDANGNLTGEERMNLYNQCQASKGFDIVGAMKFFAGVVAADLPAIAKPFIDGIGQKGCDVFLTDAQLRQRAINQHQADVNEGNQGGANLAGNRH